MKLLKIFEPQLKRAQMFKTNLCKSFLNKKCKFSSKECPFAHGKIDLKKPGECVKEVPLERLILMEEHAKAIRMRRNDSWQNDPFEKIQQTNRYNNHIHKPFTDNKQP